MPDPAKLLYDDIRNKKNYDLNKKSMEYVKENHTYINRAQSLLKVYEEGL